VRPAAFASGATEAAICELARRREDEAGGLTGDPAQAGEACDQWDRERERLTGSGLTAAEDVEAREGRRQGRGLDGEGGRAIHRDEGVDEVRGNAEIGE
jgi:hypothetical protein